MSEPSDEELMNAVAAGSIDRLGVLYDRYRQPLFNYLIRFTGDHAKSEDLLHELFLRLIRYRKTFNPSRCFRSWAFAIARNVALAAEGATDHFSALPVEAMERLHSPGSDLRTQQDQPAETVRQALQELSAADREVLLLAKVDDMKYADIGEVLGCSEGAVKVRVHRALKKLMGHLEAVSGTSVGKEEQ